MSEFKMIDGLNAYDILRMPECPIKLPNARSMTQARIDFENREDEIIEWYAKWKESKTNNEQQNLTHDTNNKKSTS